MSGISFKTICDGPWKRGHDLVSTEAEGRVIRQFLLTIEIFHNIKFFFFFLSAWQDNIAKNVEQQKTSYNRSENINCKLSRYFILPSKIEDGCI